MVIAIRKFEESDIPYKVKWINDDSNNKYLHYELPLREDKTLQWFKTLINRKDRADYTITYNEEPVGLIGLLNIDLNKRNAEYYICLGGDKFRGKGIGQSGTDLLIKKAFEEFELEEIYLYTEVDNIRAQKFFEKCGFKKESLLENHLFYNGKYIDRYKYNLNVKCYIDNASEV